MQYTLNIKLKNGRKAFFGPGPARLLEYVEKGNSLNQAAAQLGMAYSKAWRIIHEAEEALGYALLERKRGGKDGGGSALTANAQKLMQSYGQFQQQMYEHGNQLFEEYFGAPT